MKRTKFLQKIPVVYRIQSKATGQFYIGSTHNFKKRKKEHLDLFERKTHNRYLQAHCDKYGKEDFIFVILEVVPKEPKENTQHFKRRLLQREQFFMDTLNPEFNVCPLAGSCLGTKHTEKTKEKHRGENNPWFGRHLFGEDNPFYGKLHTEETKKKSGSRIKSWYNSPEGKAYRKEISKSKKGKIPWNKGKTGIYTEETLQKIRVAREGKLPWNTGLTKETDERLQKMSISFQGEKNPMFGKQAWNSGLTKETDERVQKYADSNIGRKSWNKGLTKETDIRVKQSGDAIRKQYREKMQGCDE